MVCSTVYKRLLIRQKYIIKAIAPTIHVTRTCAVGAIFYVLLRIAIVVSPFCVIPYMVALYVSPFKGSPYMVALYVSPFCVIPYMVALYVSPFCVIPYMVALYVSPFRAILTWLLCM